MSEDDSESDMYVERDGTPAAAADLKFRASIQDAPAVRDVDQQPVAQHGPARAARIVSAIEASYIEGLARSAGRRT